MFLWTSQDIESKEKKGRSWEIQESERRKSVWRSAKIKEW